MSTQLLCSGYTGYGMLLNKKISLLSYDITVDRRLMYSEAMYPRMYPRMQSTQTTLDVSKLKRIGNPVIPDAYQVNVNISFETTKQILIDLIVHILTKRNKLIETSFVDNATGFQFDGKQCYIKNFNFTCQQNSLLNVDLSLFCVCPEMKYTNNDYSIFSGNLEKTQIPFNENDKPLPYWMFSIKKNDDFENDVLNFEFQFSQNIKPIYGCPGLNDQETAPSCYKLIFGLPEVKINYSKSMIESQEYDFSSEGNLSKQLFLTKTELEQSILTLYYKDTKLIVCTGAVLERITPQLINRSATSIYQFNYNIVGKLSNQ